MKKIRSIIIPAAFILVLAATSALVSCDSSSSGMFQDIVESELPDSTKYQIISYVDKSTSTAYIVADNTKLVAYTGDESYTLISAAEVHDVFPILSGTRELLGFVYSDDFERHYFEFGTKKLYDVSEDSSLWRPVSTRPISNTEDEILWQHKKNATYYCISPADEATLQVGIFQPENRPGESTSAYLFQFSATEIGQQFLISDPDNLKPEYREYLIMTYHLQTGSTTTYLPQAYTVKFGSTDGEAFLDEKNIGFACYAADAYEAGDFLAVTRETTSNNVYNGEYKTDYSLSDWTAIKYITDGVGDAIISKNTTYSYASIIATPGSVPTSVTSISEGWASQSRTGKVRDMWDVRDDDGTIKYLIIATEDIGVFTAEMPDSLEELRTGGSSVKGVYITL